MSKGKKTHHQAEDMEEESRSLSGRGEPAESEMLVMFKAMMAEQRKADEAREEKRREEDLRREEARQAELQRLEEARQLELRRLEETRVKREMELVARQAVLQKELEARQFDQQVALIKMQQEMGEKATQTHRKMIGKETGHFTVSLY